MEAEKMAEIMADILNDKKAKDITVIDLQAVSVFTDYFVICTGTSNVHMRAIADEVLKTFSQAGLNPQSVGGYSAANWILMDYGNVILHIFNQETREFYHLERLWSDGNLFHVGDYKAAATM